MISLLQYILESVLSNELSKELKIEEITAGKAHKILKETNGLKKLGMDDISDIVYWGVSNHYQMVYKNNCIGIFALYDFNNIEDTLKKYNDDRYTRFFLQLIIRIFRIPISRKENINDTDEFLKRSIYVTYLLMLPDNQKELDISPIATIKVFFDKLQDMCKNQHKDIICANGKDEHITRLYCKCGGFKQVKDICNNNDIKFYKTIYDDPAVLDSSVYYKI
jgi:hypothetical protein